MSATTAPLVWDCYREVTGASGLGSVIEFNTEDAQSLYLASGLKTQTTVIEDGHWRDAVYGSEITLISSQPSACEWDHPMNGHLYGTGIEGDELVLYRFFYDEKDITELVKEGTWAMRRDSQITQVSLTLHNPGEETVLESSLFEPGASVLVNVTMGDSELYPLGVGYLDEINFDAMSPTMSLTGRNSIGYLLNQQTFDGDTEFEGTGHGVVEWIFGLAGIHNYVIGPSDYSTTWVFEPSDTFLKGLNKVFEFFAPWEMMELPDGKIIVGYPWFISDYIANSVYQFHGGTDIMRRKIKKAADGAYARIRVTGKDANGTELTPVLLNVDAFTNWNIGAHKTKHIRAADGMTQTELQAYAENLAESLANIGVSESYTGPMRPWLMVGDIASITWDGVTSEDLGLITSIKHRFGENGFFTDFTVDSGGSITGTTETITQAAEVNGYNRDQNLADLIIKLANKE